MSKAKSSSAGKIENFLESIYISPLESCNLHCRYCYTHKTKNVLSNSQILDFIKRYRSHLRSTIYDLQSIIFCGGEVFILPDFIELVNTLLSQKIFISIITNGTIDQLNQITDPKNCQLLVSLDGPKNIHDANRGQGNFAKTKAFIRHALDLGFPVEIFFLITKDSYPYKDSFSLFDLPKTYLTDRLGSLTPLQILDIKQHYSTFPSKNFGCFQLALQSDGLIYGCCESPTPLAKISDPISKIIKNFEKSLSVCQKCKLYTGEVNQFFARNHPRFLRGREHEKLCLRAKKCAGCCFPSFNCGYSKQLQLHSCQDVIKSFNP